MLLPATLLCFCCTCWWEKSGKDEKRGWKKLWMTSSTSAYRAPLVAVAENWAVDLNPGISGLGAWFRSISLAALSRCHWPPLTDKDEEDTPATTRWTAKGCSIACSRPGLHAMTMPSPAPPSRGPFPAPSQAISSFGLRRTTISRLESDSPAVAHGYGHQKRARIIEKSHNSRLVGGDLFSLQDSASSRATSPSSYAANARSTSAEALQYIVRYHSHPPASFIDATNSSCGPNCR